MVASFLLNKQVRSRAAREGPTYIHEKHLSHVTLSFHENRDNDT